MARHPIMNYREQRELRVPDLMGGLNTRDSLSMVNDNQLTDSLNMWWHDGILKTRPGLLDKDMDIGIVAYDEEISPKQTDVYIGQYRLCCCGVSGTRQSSTIDGTTETFAETKFWLQGSERVISLPSIHNQCNVSFVCQKGKTVYAFVGGGANKIFKNDIYFKDGELQCDGWTEVGENEIYKPLIYTNCFTDGIGNSFDGVQFEGYSLLTPWARMKYSNVNRKLLDASNEEATHSARYNIPNELIANPYTYSNLKETLVVRITNKDANIVEHKVDTNVNIFRWEESEAKTDGKRIAVQYGEEGTDSCILVLIICDESGKELRLTAKDYLEDNIEIEIKTKSDTSAEAKVFNMTQCTWFGGDAAGISGGSRLFLCGNTSEDEKALVAWSGLNKPLYFSENCYAYVGNENQAVTCFGKQGETLVMFKENGAGSYYTQYVKADSINASDLINQSVIDYAASSVYFPIITLHPTIGCDCPNTVQLCRNRLVWTCSDGNVYTLASQNQYSERNIYCVSEMISRKLKTESNLQNAFSADWEGHYLLFAGNKVYVMDYESYGYAYIASHTKTENAQTKIPWWYWELPKNTAAVIALGVQLFVINYEDNGLLGDLKIRELSCEEKADFGEVITSMIQTKLFDFSLPAYKKNVRLVNLSLGNNGGVPIKVEFITEHGTEEQEVTLDSGDTENRTAGYIRNKAVYPCIKAVKRFGVRLYCEGEMATDGISFNYTVLGGVR